MTGNNKINLKEEKGVTLIELLISITVFVIALSININIFINSIKAQQQSIETQNVADNLRYAMEVISRELRTMNLSKTKDSSYCLDDASCMRSNGDYSSSISFVSGSENRSGNVIKVSFNNGAIMFDDDSINSPGDDVSITSPNIDVLNVKFIADNISNFSQPKITIVIQARSVNSLSTSTTTLQTTVSPREINLPQ